MQENKMILSESYPITIDGSQDSFQIKLLPYSNGKVFQIGRYAMKIFPYQSKEFEREKSFAFLKHEHILDQIISSGQQNQNGCIIQFSFIATPYCQSGNFAQLGNRGVSLNEKVLRFYFRNLINTVEYLHSNGVYHLDIKPENMFLDYSYKMYLGDFGIACTNGMKNISDFTPDYCPPEANKSEFEFAPAEIYTIGVTFLNLLFRCNTFDSEKPENRMDYYSNPEKFWGELEAWRGLRATSEFKFLIQTMISENPKNRLSLEKIKESDWYNGELCKDAEVEKYFNQQFDEARKKKF